MLDITRAWRIASGSRQVLLGIQDAREAAALLRRPSRYARLVLKPRNRELLGLIPSALLVTAGFTAIFIQQENSSLEASTNVTLNRVSSLSLTYGLLFLGLCLAAHLVIRFALPYADPYLFPLAAVLASVGIVMVYRINPSLARQQAQWMVLGLVLFAVTILWLRRTGIGVLERYRYTIAAVGILMAVLPRFPVIGEQVNGSYLDIHFGSVSFQPAELAKVAIVIFLASYLRDNRQILVTAGRRVLGLTVPPMKQFGPMLVVWGAAMGTLLLTGELGTSLMFYGAFLALLYVATGRFSFPLIGLVLFGLGAWFVVGHVGHVHARVLAWEHPLEPKLFHNGVSYQLGQSLFAQADGGLLGTGFDQSLLVMPAYARTDPAGARKRHDLCGHRQRAGPCRRGSAATHLSAVHCTWAEDGDARARLVLQAAGGRAVVHHRHAGVRDRGRRHARYPAHGGDAAVRGLRRLVGGHELRVAGVVAGRLRPGAQAVFVLALRRRWIRAEVA